MMKVIRYFLLLAILIPSIGFAAEPPSWLPPLDDSVPAEVIPTPVPEAITSPEVEELRQLAKELRQSASDLRELERAIREAAKEKGEQVMNATPASCECTCDCLTEERFVDLVKEMLDICNETSRAIRHARGEPESDEPVVPVRVTMRKFPHGKCVSCERFRLVDLPKLRKRKIAFDERADLKSGRAPQFTVFYSDGTIRLFEGYFTADKLLETPAK